MSDSNQDKNNSFKKVTLSQIAEVLNRCILEEVRDSRIESQISPVVKVGLYILTMLGLVSLSWNFFIDKELAKAVVTFIVIAMAYVWWKSGNASLKVLRALGTASGQLIISFSVMGLGLIDFIAGGEPRSLLDWARFCLGVFLLHLPSKSYLSYLNKKISDQDKEEIIKRLRQK